MSTAVERKRHDVKTHVVQDTRNTKPGTGWISYLRIGVFYANFSITIAEFLKFQ